MSLPRLGVVIVTMGNRPRELEALLASVEKQDVPAARVVLVGNATPLTISPGARSTPDGRSATNPSWSSSIRRPLPPGTPATTGSPPGTGSGWPTADCRCR